MDKFEKKMKDAGLSQAAIAAFRMNYDQLAGGATGLVGHAIWSGVPEQPIERNPACWWLQSVQLPEKEIDAVPELPKLVDLKTSSGANKQVEKTT